MRHKERKGSISRRNLECPEFPIIGKLGVCSDVLETSQSLDHFVFPDRSCTSFICAVFAISRKCHEHHGCQESEQHLKEEDGNHIPPPGAFPIVFEDIRVDDMPDDASEENNKRVQYSLKECHSNHIAIEDVAHLMSDNSFHFRSSHRTQETR